MSVRSRVTQDRRSLTRIPALLACEFTYAGVTRQAVIVDLSLDGAFLSSKFLPPRGGAVSLTLSSPHLKAPLSLDAKVVRGGWGMSDHGELGRFGIRFNRGVPELISLVSALISKGEVPDRSAPAERK